MLDLGRKAAITYTPQLACLMDEIFRGILSIVEPVYAQLRVLNKASSAPCRVRSIRMPSYPRSTSAVFLLSTVRKRGFSLDLETKHHTATTHSQYGLRIKGTKVSGSRSDSFASSVGHSSCPMWPHVPVRDL